MLMLMLCRFTGSVCSFAGVRSLLLLYFAEDKAHDGSPGARSKGRIDVAQNRNRVQFSSILESWNSVRLNVKRKFTICTNIKAKR